MTRKIILVLIVLVLAQAIVGTVQAIPAFARKYSLSCKTCHAPFPRLKKYGLDFAANGFALPDKEAPRAVIDTGDTRLSLLRELPLAIRIDSFLTFNNSGALRLDLASPTILRLLSGGEIAKDISYSLNFTMTDLGKVVGLENAFLMLRNLFGTGFDVSFGQFQVSRPVFRRELRLTYEDYQIYNARPGLSRIDLGYDRGLMVSRRLPSGTDLNLEFLTGAGLNEAGFKQTYDFDKFKNLMFRVSQNLGEQIRVGGFGFLGWEKQTFRNDIWMLAADITIDSSPFILNGQYVERHDSNPYFFYEVVPADVPAVVTRGAFAELILMPQGDNARWYAAGLFNWVSSDFAALKHLSFTAHVGYLYSRNLRFIAEGTYYINSYFGQYPRLAAGIVTGF